jgi:hypothetical protein
MSSVKRPYNETISSNSSNSINTTLNNSNDNNDYIVNVVEEQHEAEVDMDIEHYLKIEQISKPNDSFKNQQETEEDSRRKRLNTDKDTFISNPFPSTLNGNHYSHTTSSTPHPPSRNPFYKYPPTFTNVTNHPLSGSNYISPRDSVNNNTYNASDSTLKISEITKAPSPIDLLMSSPPISTSTQKTNRTRNTSNSSLTLTTNDLDTWSNIDDFNYTYSSRDSTSKLHPQTNTNTSNDSSAEALSSTFSYLNAANPHSSLNSTNSDGPCENINNSSSNDDYSINDNINNVSSNNNNKNSNNNNVNNSSSDNGNNNNPTSDNDNYFSSIYDVAPNNQFIRTKLTNGKSRGPFERIYSQIYDNEGKVVDIDSFNYLIQLYEFCDGSSSRLQSNVTAILRDLVLLLNNQIDDFDIPFIEHHKWNGTSFYGPIDIITLLDQLDDGLGLSSAEFVFYKNDGSIETSGSVLQCGYRKSYRRGFRDNDQGSSSFTSSVSKTINRSNDTNDLQNNELRHAVLDKDAEREAELFLELLAQEEEEGVEDNGAEQGENSTEQEDSASSSELEDSDSFTEISKESEYEEDDDDSLDEDFASIRTRQLTTCTDTFGNLINPARTTSNITRRISRPSDNDDGNETDNTESTFEEVDYSDIESIATDSTVEDGWHSVSRNNN